MTFSEIVDKIIDLVNMTIPLLISLAVVLFFFHTGKGIFKGGDSATFKSELNITLFWGVIIIFVMVSIWGILNFLGSELNLIRSGL